MAILLRTNRKTVARKLIHMGLRCKIEEESRNLRRPKVSSMEFDDIHDIEHTKYKPLGILVALESKTRLILGFGVASMPATGLLAKKSVEKYGPRKDERAEVRRALFKSLQSRLAEGCIIKSDENPHYPKDVKEFFPGSPHERYKGRRSRDHGLGELKEGGFDELFSFNLTAAMYRANINRLFRQTWCTTKKKERLADHIAIYVHFHNTILLNQKR